MNTPSINTAPLRIDSLDSTVFKSFSALILPSVQELVQTQQELRKIAEENKHKIKIISLNQDCVTSWMQASVELEARKAKLQDEINRKAVMKAEEDEIDELSSESRHDSIPLATDHGYLEPSDLDQYPALWLTPTKQDQVLSLMAGTFLYPMVVRLN